MMSSEPPGLLARRAVHQYRRRDAFAHTALRHHLRAACAQRDGWAERVDTDLVMTRGAAGYLRVQSFKELDEECVPQFRALWLPGPAEMMAEAALLRACAEAGGPFAVPPNVYSYPLTTGDDARGVFVPYWEGYQRRQADLRAACRRDESQQVVYLDIRRFYPSVTLHLAGRAWRDACGEAGLPVRWTDLGLKLIADQSTCGGEGAGWLLTGPMFSHLLGNLVLRELDQAMLADAPDRYFRYVDDIALVASPAEIARLEQRVVEQLGRLGLELHPGKRLEASAEDWRRSRSEFAGEPEDVTWGLWLARVRQAMLFRPEERESLSATLAANDIRVRPLDYGPVAQGRSYLQRMRELASLRWFRAAVRRETTARELVLTAIDLRDRHVGEFFDLVPRYESLTNFPRKHGRSRMNFLIGRLIYLAPRARLPEVADALGGHAEYAAAAAVMRALYSRDVTDLLSFGTSAAQVAARPLRAGGENVTCGSPPMWGDAATAAAAVLRLEGLQIKFASPPPRNMLLRLADWRSDSEDLLESPDPFAREFACLHGVDDADANRRANDEAFDRDDQLALHLGQLLGGSS